MATALIQLPNIVHNAKLMRSLVAGSKIYVVLSADAFGHGAVPVSRVLEPLVDGFAVGRPNEAFELRSAGTMRPILVLSGCWTSVDLRRLSREACDIVVHSEIQIKLLEATHMEKPINVWMELDLGLHGTGFREEIERVSAFERLTACENVIQPPNFISRLSSAATLKGSIVTANEIGDFDAFVRNKPGMRCIASSSSICLYPDAIKDVVRIGKAIYGICPVPGRGCLPQSDKSILTLRQVNFHGHYHGDINTGSRCLGLKPVMTLKAKLLAVRGCRQGERIGFLGRQRAAHDTKLGVVSVGYGDGYPSRVPEETPMWVNGRLCPIVDQPTMDTTTIDLGIDSNERVGDEVICWGGDRLPLEMLAAHLNVAPHSLCSMLTRRVTRHISS